MTIGLYNRTNGKDCQPKDTEYSAKKTKRGRDRDEAQGPLRILQSFEDQRDTKTLKNGENLRNHLGIRLLFS